MKLSVTLVLLAMCVTSTSTVLEAQRGGMGARAGGVGGVHPAPPISGGGRGMGPGRGAGPGRGSGRGSVVNVPRGGFQFRTRMNLPLAPPPLSAVNPTPPPGFGPQRRSPFSVGPGYYNRMHGYGSFGIPIDGYGGYGGGYGQMYGPSYPEETTYDRYFRQPEEPEMTAGMLFVEVSPSTASAFVDSAFVGNGGDLQARGVTLTPGHHWLDLEAAGYDKKTVEINVTAGEPLRYRVDLTPTARAAAVVLPRRPPETMYAIPGCYGGNRPPVADRLPAGCDIAKVRVIRPQPQTN